MIRPLIIGVLALSLAGCKKNETPAAPATAGSPPAAQTSGAGAPFYTTTLAHLARAGIKVGEFEITAAKPYQARACARGAVEGLDCLLCQYAGESGARSGEKLLAEFLGSATTGAIRIKGLTALAVADRKKQDLDGKRINKLLWAFLKQGS